MFSQEYELNTETIYKKDLLKKKQLNCIEVIPEIILTPWGIRQVVSQLDSA